MTTKKTTTFGNRPINGREPKYKRKPDLVSDDGLLVIREVKYSQHFCEGLACDKRKNGAVKGLLRNADRYLCIMGIPTAKLCKGCADSWLEMWNKEHRKIVRATNKRDREQEKQAA